MKRVGLFFGGMSNEAEVSITSARNIAANLDTARYVLVPVFWHSSGKFYIVSSIDERVGGREMRPEQFRDEFDIAFPITHGRFGEDGVLQGVFEIAGVPYCGCRVLSSALCMDKAVFKTLLAAHAIPQTRFAVLDEQRMTRQEQGKILDTVRRDFALPWFVKPANSGSSVGITRVTDVEQLNDAIAVARKHDRKVLIEEGFTGHQEIEIAILGNSELHISPAGMLKPSQEFYDYSEKYVLDKTVFTIPALLSDALATKATALAEWAYRLCDCQGFARIDLFVKGDVVFLNEINTLPGFTNISMYPRLMQAGGLSYSELISAIIDMAY